MSLFRLYPVFKMSFEHKSASKNLFLSLCFFLNSRFPLLEMDQKFKFGGIIGYTDSYLDFILGHFKVFRLQTLLNDAAGAVRADSDKSSGYCYKIGRGPNSFLLAHVTRKLFCLYIKLFLPSIFNFVNFWGSMLCIALDIKLACIIVIKDLVVFIEGNSQGYSFCPPEKYKPPKHAACCTRNLLGMCGTVNI